MHTTRTGDNPGEADLLLRMAAGDKAAFEQLYHLYYRPVCYFAQQLTGQQQEAEDTALIAFQKLWERRSSFSSLAAVRAFLYTAVRNHCFNVLKHRQVVEKAHKALAQSSIESEDYIEYRLLQTEFLHLVYAEIRALPPQHRQLLEWSFLEGLTTAEIARRLDMAESSVRSAKTRALAQLRRLLREKHLLEIALLLYGLWQEHRPH